MKQVSWLEFRKNSRKILEGARRGERMIMTYRGKPVCRLEPVVEQTPNADDPFYRLDQLAQVKGGNLSNAQMDKIIYDL